MPRTKVRDIELHWEMQSPRDDAPRLLFVGGSGGDLRQKPNVFEGPLADRFELLAFDQRGLGQSDIPDGPYTMGDYAEDIAGLLDAVGWSRCAVMGVSFGGMVGQEFAVRYPERIERLVLCCTSPGGSGGASYPLEELAQLEPHEQAARSLEISDTRLNAAWRAANPDGYERALRLYRARGEAGAGDPRRELGQRLQFEARAGHDVYDRLPSLSMPVLCCGGRRDGIAPPANMQAIRDQIPGAELVLFDGGHLFLVQDRKAFPRIASFLLGEG